VPKINVYLPDDLADAVRQANVPVSAVCQQALEEAVRRVTAVTEVTSGKASAAFAGRGPFTGRLRRALTLARDVAIDRGHGWVGTEHLLLGLLGEARNLGVAVLEGLEVDVAELRSAVDSLIEESVEGTGGEESEGAATTEPAPVATEPRPRRRELRLTPRAESALRLAQQEALKLGHNYVGCEVLRQLASSALGHRGRLPRRLARHWAELDPVERARIVESMQPMGRAGAHQGEAQGEAQASPDVGAKLDEVLRRLEAMERRLGQAG
jgi:ATP-dependent Clp protease ATP-binding subunit ClpC